MIARAVGGEVEKTEKEHGNDRQHYIKPKINGVQRKNRWSEDRRW
jgi:hypothetical protein